jgi:hypothetical protein
MAADITRSVQHSEESLYISSAVPVKGWIKVAAVASANPADAAGVTGASAVITAAVVATGVAVGDAVVGIGYVSGLAANSYILGAYVSATNEITLVIGTVVTTAVTTTAVTCTYIVADLT